MGKNSKDICLEEKAIKPEIAQTTLPIVKYNLQFTLNENLNTTDIKRQRTICSVLEKFTWHPIQKPLSIAVICL